MFESCDQTFFGYFIACCACEMGEMGDVYLGYYKVFAIRPRNFWEPGHVLAGTVSGVRQTPRRALEHAADCARREITAKFRQNLSDS